jgi:hypothetical protein
MVVIATLVYRFVPPFGGQSFPLLATPISWHCVTLRRAVDTGRLIKVARGTPVQGRRRMAAGERARHPKGQALGRQARYRRLARNYERRPAHHEVRVPWATTMIMTWQFAHQVTDQPARPRRGGERRNPPPTQQDQQTARAGSPTGPEASGPRIT